MIFVTSCYQNTYAPFLAVLLRSIRQSHPETRVLVTYDGLPRGIVHALDAANPCAVFLRHSTALADNRTQRIGAKLGFWSAALDRVEDGETVAFIDADTVVRGRLEDALAPGADLLVTVKPEVIPINSGVVIMRQATRIRSFLDEWRRMTAEICTANPVDSAKQYGGPDQEALLRLMGDEQPAPGRYTVGDITIQAEPCAIYNESRPVRLSAPAKVFHYKSHWQQIVIDDHGYSKTRTRELCSDMRSYWRQMLFEEERELGFRFVSLRKRTLQELNNWRRKIKKELMFKSSG